MTMKKYLSVILIPLFLAGCSTSEDSSAASENGAKQEAPEFKTQTEAGVDVSDQLPPENAWKCDSRTVETTDGPETVKNFNFEGTEATFYFAPKANDEFNSYSYRLNFEHGIMVMEDEAAGTFNSFIQVYPSTEKETVNTGLGSNYLTASFEVPGEYLDRLGSLEGAYASINGELAGSCSS